MAGLLAAWLVRLLAGTLRVRLVDLEALAPVWKGDRPLIWAVWHGRILMVPWASLWLRRRLGARRISVLTSRSRDGDLVARWVERFDLGTVRGSTSRGGAASLRRLCAALRAGEDVAVVPDGPRGPRGRLQAGVVALAALSGASVVPLGVGARPAWRLGTWDEFLIPLPFARCAVVVGEPVSVGRDADREEARVSLERALGEATAAADRLVSA